MLLRHRIHEWLADRFEWVQYPNIRADTQRRAARAGPQRLDWAQRLGLGMAGVFGLIGAAALLLWALYLLWALIAASHFSS